jgi:signal transduction histidine kinase
LNNWPKHFSFLLQIPIAIAMVGAFLSYGAYMATQQYVEQAELHLAIDFDITEAMSSLRRSIQANLAYCNSMVGLFEASNQIDRQEFRRFAKRQMNYDKTISLQALEWIPLVKQNQRSDYEHRARAEGYLSFQFTEKSELGQSVRAATREEYYPVYFVEPWQGNEKAFGFDLGSNATRLAALIKARDTGLMVATAPVRLVQERGEQHGFLLFAPIYQSVPLPEDISAHHARLLGFALGVYRVGDLISAALKQTPSMTDFIVRVQDVTDGKGDEIYRSADSSAWNNSSEWLTSKSLDVAGRQWRINFFPSPAYIAKKKSPLPVSMLVVGLLITLSLTVIFMNQQRRRHEAEQFRLSSNKILKEKLAVIDKLNEAQNQLLQSEKMASIGQLSAGIAHEINNPVGYVASNLKTLNLYFDRIVSLIKVYELQETKLPGEAQDTVKKIKSEIELDYLFEDIPALLKESTDGLSRVSKIVIDLKSFAHAAADVWEIADIQEGLESTLNVVWNELKYKVDLVRDYNELPQIECKLSQLNQVFLNMLVNAAQAIKEHGIITLRTRQAGDQVIVEISDTGQGIAKENLIRIFDPFFTTKPVGKGTGLGLTLSYGIVKKHHGKIEVESKIGSGTTFRIYLPIRQPLDVV